MAAMFSGFIHADDSSKSGNRCERVHEPDLRRSPHDEPEQFDRADDEQSGLCPLTPFLVFHDGWARAGRSLAPCSDQSLNATACVAEVKDLPTRRQGGSALPNLGNRANCYSE